MTIVFGVTPPLPKTCPTCKRPTWQWNGEQQRWECLRCANPNPCVTRFGTGPAGLRCKECAHLVQKHHDKVYYKCELRGNTNGAGTDHRVGWATCARFEEETEPISMGVKHD